EFFGTGPVWRALAPGRNVPRSGSAGGLRYRDAVRQPLDEGSERHPADAVKAMAVLAIDVERPHERRMREVEHAPGHERGERLVDVQDVEVFSPEEAGDAPHARRIERHAGFGA